MTQEATPAAVRGNFTNVTLTWNGEDYRLSRRDDAFFVEMTDPDWKYRRLLQEQDFKRGHGPRPEPVALPPRVERRVTLTTGSHHMQTYWVAGDYGNQQFSVPFTYLFEDERWLPRNDVFLLPPDAPLALQMWNNNCLGCHATAGQPQIDSRDFIPRTRVAEYGIACESCHGPGEKHVEANTKPARRYALRRKQDGDPTIVNPARLSAKKSSEVCGQCHAARFGRPQDDWMINGTDYWHRDNLEARRPLLPAYQLRQPVNPNDAQEKEHRAVLERYLWPDGMIRVSGREFNGLKDSPCHQRGELSCLSCHSMHQSKPADQLARGMEGNAACLQCHGDMAGKIEQHTRHAAGSSGSLCYNCHMPHTTYGLLKGIRSHQITSPSVRSCLDTGRPNACNLCHLDRTLAWTAEKLNAWYRHPLAPVEGDFARVPASVAWLLRGDAGQRAILAWHMGWEPARQISGTNWLVPYLAETLDDPYSVVRYVGQRSLRSLPTAAGLKYDYVAPASQRLAAKADLLRRWNVAELPAGERTRVLSPDQIRGLLQRRDNRPMELLE